MRPRGRAFLMRVLALLALGLALVAPGCTATCSGLYATFDAPGIQEAIPAAAARGSIPLAGWSNPPLAFDTQGAGLLDEVRAARLVAVIWSPSGVEGLELSLNNYRGAPSVLVSSDTDLTDDQTRGWFLEFASALSIEDAESLVPGLLASRDHDPYFGPESERFWVALNRGFDATGLHASLGPAQPLAKEDPGAFHTESLGEWAFRFDLTPPQSFPLATRLGDATISFRSDGLAEAKFHERALGEADGDEAKAAVQEALAQAGLPHAFASWSAQPASCV